MLNINLLALFTVREIICKKVSEGVVDDRERDAKPHGDQRPVSREPSDLMKVKIKT